ncbi:MAG: class I SAM-dependent methyltransferase [Lyngbya sp. HA4199-MV5]|jgi:hypothetical protein|nr:class I SAM-dependent methyltransferase [Lyngbya sp. HA4199-MV5]
MTLYDTIVKKYLQTRQSVSHPSIQWLEGYAEQLLLLDQSADAAIVMLAFHHFQDDCQALQEIDRVVGGRQIVLFRDGPTHAQAVGVICSTSPLFQQPLSLKAKFRLCFLLNFVRSTFNMGTLSVVQFNHVESEYTKRTG